MSAPLDVKLGQLAISTPSSDSGFDSMASLKTHSTCSDTTPNNSQSSLEISESSQPKTQHIRIPEHSISGTSESTKPDIDELKSSSRASPSQVVPPDQNSRASAPLPKSSSPKPKRAHLCPYDRNFGVCNTVKGLLNKYHLILDDLLYKRTAESLPQVDLNLLSDCAQLLNARVLVMMLLPMQTPHKNSTPESITDAIKPALDELYTKIVPTFVGVVNNGLTSEGGQRKDGKKGVPFVPACIRRDIVLHVKNVVSTLIKVVDNLPSLCQAYGHLFNEKTSLPTEPFPRVEKELVRSKMLAFSGVIQSITETLIEYAKPHEVITKYLNKFITYAEQVKDSIREIKENDHGFDYFDSSDSENEGRTDDASLPVSVVSKASRTNNATSNDKEVMKCAEVSREDDEQAALRIKDTEDGLGTILTCILAIRKLLDFSNTDLLLAPIEKIDPNGHILDFIYTNVSALQNEADEIAGSFMTDDIADMYEHLAKARLIIKGLGSSCRYIRPYIPKAYKDLMDLTESTFQVLYVGWGS